MNILKTIEKYQLKITPRYLPETKDKIWIVEALELSPEGFAFRSQRKYTVHNKDLRAAINEAVLAYKNGGYGVWACPKCDGLTERILRSERTEKAFCADCREELNWEENGGVIDFIDSFGEGKRIKWRANK